MLTVATITDYIGLLMDWLAVRMAKQDIGTLNVPKTSLINVCYGVLARDQLG